MITTGDVTAGSAVDSGSSGAEDSAGGMVSTTIGPAAPLEWSAAQHALPMTAGGLAGTLLQVRRLRGALE
eukprot:CAMPEP_0204605716 /NCGR_PEP_ID=MMETSP0661-20131031/58654_1 /ASSEMBLY_ACC=CAM_ASM_000606 /TAXON_ID=109239 /ORGANISM="Alexandrium margalefi, Strain AMGDE01CS-322" /LENGTH=69 /DNA_ID=CAMNT_0051616977 /DNA_START=51 /DNA_END=257 /DNA_ORIENTATION=-